MSDHLEQFIHHNRAEFEVYEPAPDLWNKIKSKHKRRTIMTGWPKYALAALVIFALGFSFGNLSDQTIISTAKHSQGQVQIIESEYYYQTKINEQMQLLQPYFQHEPRLKKDIDTDFKELDNYCSEIKEDLQDNINNEDVIEALIKSYQTKLSILESLLQQLTQEEHETYNSQI